MDQGKRPLALPERRGHTEIRPVLYFSEQKRLSEFNFYPSEQGQKPSVKLIKS